MSTQKRLINFVLHGSADKFKTVLKEEMTNRAVDMIYNKTLLEQQEILKNIKTITNIPADLSPVTESVKFYPENSYQLKDGNVGILDHKERENISKLYENLNNSNKERLLKLLTESQQSFNRIVKLAKIESKKDNK